MENKPRLFAGRIKPHGSRCTRQLHVQFMPPTRIHERDENTSVNSLRNYWILSIHIRTRCKRRCDAHISLWTRWWCPISCLLTVSVRDLLMWANYTGRCRKISSELLKLSRGKARRSKCIYKDNMEANAQSTCFEDKCEQTKNLYEVPVLSASTSRQIKEASLPVTCSTPCAFTGNEAKQQQKFCRSQHFTKNIAALQQWPTRNSCWAAKHVPRVSSRSFASVDIECVEIDLAQLSQWVLQKRGSLTTWEKVSSGW